MDYFKKLPEEINLEILTRLPTISVLGSKLVCTNWRKIISNHPSFSMMHFRYHLNHPAAESAGKLGFLVLIGNRRYGLHYFEYNQNHDGQSTKPIQGITKINLTSPFKFFRFLGSYNGLICLLAHGQKHPSVWICNPITREFLILPEIKRDSDPDRYDYGETCFAYVSSTNEYKIVRFCNFKTCLEVHIYTLGSGNGWRNLGRFNFGCKQYFKRKVFFANGTLYSLDSRSKMIGTFDLTEEKFCEHLPLPPLPPETCWIDYKIGILEGFLFFALADQGDRLNDIWLLKKNNHNLIKEEGEEHQSLGWKKEFRIDAGDLIAVTKSDGVFSYGGYGLYIYDTKTSTSKCLVEFNSYIVKVLPQKNSLVSLKELGEEDAKVLESLLA